jgi:hypothetical protein
MNSDKFAFWGIEVDEEYRQFYELFESVDTPKQAKVRDKVHDFYKSIGISPKNPINGLKELEVKLVIDLHYKAPESERPPFYCKVSVSAFKGKKQCHGEYSDYNKKIAKVYAHAKVCEQLYLPFHLKDWYIPMSLSHIHKNDHEKKFKKIKSINSLRE